MISSVFEHMKIWVCETLGEVDVIPEPPQLLGNPDNKRSVSVYLKDVGESPSSGTLLKMDRLQVQLTFLVTANGKTLLEACDDLVKLAFAAMLEKNMEIVLTPMTAEEWSAFGVVPRPSFFLRLPLNFEVEKPEVKRVEKPLILRSSSLSNNNNK
jgi:hypothetical protein